MLRYEINFDKQEVTVYRNHKYLANFSKDELIEISDFTAKIFGDSNKNDALQINRPFVGNSPTYDTPF